jgi:wyosine [tRNA(Phe)-imidazoG37] synthetase (radical SAM superfamily)
VDNNADIRSFEGKKVYRPGEVDLKGYFVVVASRNYYKEIRTELQSMGLQENKDFAHFNSYHCPEDMLRKTINANPVADIKCHYPFDFCQISGGGYVNLCCLGMRVSPGEIKERPFFKVWDSIEAKILRLSIINKTFCFCNTGPCPMIKRKEEYAYEELFDPADYDLKPMVLPKEINVSIDHTCNLKCAHCRKSVLIADAEERKEIDAIADRLIDEVLPHTNFIVLAGNGEVFFSETYIRMWKSSALAQKRDSIGILTNGILFSEEIWKELRGSYKSIGFGVSIDAATEDTYKKVRGGNFKKLCENMALLSRLKKNGELYFLDMNFVVRQDNCKELKPFILWAKSLGVDHVCISRVENWVYDEREFNEKITIYDQNNDLKEEFKDVFADEILHDPIVKMINIKI